MNKGVSLISLIITIICIIILAAIVISEPVEEVNKEEKIYCPTCGQKLKNT